LELSIRRKTLVSAVNAASKATDSKGGQPVLAYLLLSSKEKDKITITGHNTLLCLTTSLAGTFSPEEFVIHAEMLRTLLASCTTEDIKLIHKGKTVTLQSGNYTAVLPTLPIDMYPPKPVITPTKQVTVTCEDLRAAVKQTEFAVAENSPKEVLNGFFITRTDKDIFLVATDNTKLSYAKLRPLTMDGEINAVIPARPLQDLVSLLPEGNSDVALQFDDKLVATDLPNISFSARLIADKYIAWNDVVTQSYSHRLRFKRSELLEAMLRAQSMTRFEEDYVSITAESDVATITVNGQSGSSKEEISCELAGKEKTQISLDVDCAVRGLSAMPCSEISLGLNSSTKPIEVVPIGSEGKSGQVWMPVFSE